MGVMNMNHKSQQHLAEVNQAQCEERQAAGQRRHDDFMKARDACASDASEGRLYTGHPCDGLPRFGSSTRGRASAAERIRGGAHTGLGFGGYGYGYSAAQRITGGRHM